MVYLHLLNYLFFNTIINKYMEFSKKHIMREAWSITKANLSNLLIITALYLSFILLLFQIFSLMSPDFTEGLMSNNIREFLNLSLPPMKNFLFLIASVLFITGLNLGFIQASIDCIKNKKISPMQLFTSFDILFIYLLSTIIYIFVQFCVAMPGLMILFIMLNFNFPSIFTIAGLFISFFPTIYLSIRLQFYVYFLIDQKRGCLESLMASFKISKGFTYQIFIISAILSIIIQVSIIPLFIGLLVALPYSKLVMTYLYIFLLKND